MASSNLGSNLNETQVAPIFFVPPPLRSVAHSFLFSPQIISIGPLHHNFFFTNPPDSPDYQEMHRLKELAVQKISQDLEFKELKAFLKKNDGRVREHYEHRIHASLYNSDQLAETIAYDACFIAAFLHCLFEENFVHFEDKIGSTNELRMLENMKLPARFAPIYRSMLSRPVQKAIIQDLLLVENQIPLFAVQKVIRMDQRRDSDKDADKLLEFYVAALAYRAHLPFNRSRRNVLAAVNNLSKNAKHLLDCMYSIACAHSDAEDISHADPYPIPVPGAHKLQISGVILEGHGGSLSDISFKRGILSIPRIHVGEDTERMFRNLIVYESSCKVEKVDVISYLFFMDCLIETAEDVDLLIDKEIIKLEIGSHVNVGEMWERLCRNTPCVYSSNYQKATEMANHYINSSCLNKMWAGLFRPNPSIRWFVVSLISSAAALLAISSLKETSL